MRRASFGTRQLAIMVNQPCIGAILHIATTRTLQLAAVGHQLFATAGTDFDLSHDILNSRGIFLIQERDLLFFEFVWKL